jgi:hypothetical protein
VIGFIIDENGLYGKGEITVEEDNKNHLGEGQAYFLDLVVGLPFPIETPLPGRNEATQ